MKMKMSPNLALVMQTARDCHGVLAAARIDHVIIGGLAVYLHGDNDRKPRDVDLLTRFAETGRIRASLTSAQYDWHSFRKAYISPLGVRTEPHWDGKNGRKLPNLDATEVVHIQDLPVIGLAPLIDTKLQCLLDGQSKHSGESKHRADVLALVRLHQLRESYADNLSSAVREIFCELVASEAN